MSWALALELNGRERQALRAICDTLFPSLPGSDFYARKGSDLGVDSLLAEAIETSLQPGNAKDFRRILSVFDSPLYNLALSGRPVRFSELGPEARERYLQAWRDSPIALKRTAFQALKRLALFLAYASMDSGGSNPNWSAIGYPGAHHGGPTPTPETLRLSPLKIESDTKLECDAVVVGSGAGGSVIAEELAKAGHSVVVLEQGPYETSETFMQNEMRMMQKLFQQSGTAATKDLSFVLLAGRGAGGGTTVNWNTCLRPPVRVLSEWEREFGIEGVTGAQFASYVEEVWTALGVNSRESQRNGNNSVLWDGCKALGYEEGKDFHIIERNAVDCRERCDYCTYGCIYAAKQSTAMTYLPAAEKRGARFVFDARVESVVIEDGTAKGVVAKVQSGGRSRDLEVKSRVVVAACGGIETPALLLRSGVKDKNVGRYLRLDPTAAVGGVLDKPIDPWKGPPQTVAVWKFIDLDGTYHGFWIEAAPAHPGLFALSIPWVSGQRHKEFMERYYSRSSASIVLVRELSTGNVSVDRDGYGVVTYDLKQADRGTLVRGMEETARIIAAAGGVGVWATHNSEVFAGDGKKPLSPGDLDSFSAAVRKAGVNYNRMMLYSAHLMGSCRMSADPSLGPTSPRGELHEVRNLFVGDACVFPTTPAVNPMISIMAMSRRTADSIKATLRAK
jgi:choline dehydrogenase-like flavoprotein